MALAPVSTQARTRLIENGKFKIIIMDAPNDSNSLQYVAELKEFGVTDVVRTCEPTYSPDNFEKQGIQVHEMMFPDGAPPPDETLAKWVDLIRERYKSNGKDGNGSGLVAVHCVAGLGRAPVMAAVAMIEMTAMDPMDAVLKIREKQKGAINARQLKFLQAYKRTTKKDENCKCAVM
eukprot:gnl/TRDRNA2_/TRDRNA2_55382_c0_seq1.p1 gnl/TRDRNA2_/TRDRNA2_55382_c0~~gnl/TRDRNA2_/TRDRNA2_55382_c0_seq1.p1  ORF type:complete len:177 (-),score=34.55 gnl/TRDRNA2_/TRDRNA2_55382_c0_seq1:76-606(-)